MKTTRYFEEQVLRKRPYIQHIQRQWCVEIVGTPIARATQADGRIRFWGKVTVPDDPNMRYLRVVTLADGETIHNAFFDRNFRESQR